MKNVNHYEKNGKLFTGKTHKHPDGTLMSGAKMGKTSKVVLHFGELSDSSKKKARSQW
jgi:hypothetical protein|tara:strand:+ start:1571 stop:1744 length:174 start_codon:yes stop_codon:yes gene_type:complete